MSNNNELRGKTIERVKALLAMGNDVSSPNEAAIALKRARALMDKHQIGMTEIQSWDTDENNFDDAVFETGWTQRQYWFERIVARIGKLNDCKVSITWEVDTKRQRMILAYQFQGFAEDVSLSEFMSSYIHEACLNLYKRDKQSLGIKGNGGKNSYLVGLSNGLCFRIDDMIKERKEQSSVQGATGTSLMVLKAQAVAERFGETQYSRRSQRGPSDSSAYRAGHKASKDVHLGSFVGSSTSGAQRIS